MPKWPTFGVSDHRNGRIGRSGGIGRQVFDRFGGGGGGGGAGAPVISGVPTISGSNTVGSTLTATPASVTGSPTPTRTWQWRRNGVNIAGATNGSYVLVTADGSTTITVVQTETNANGSASATSAGFSVAAAPSGPILDTLSALAAWSTERVRTGATQAVRVRRSTDNALAIIGFDGSGNLDTTALLAHCGSGSGFVDTWYDQSGNGRDLTITTTFQPRIVNAGVVETLNSKPAIRFRQSGTVTTLRSSSPFMYAAGALTAFMVTNSETTQSPGATMIGERGGTASYSPLTRGTVDLDQALFTLRNDAGTNIVLNGNLTQNAWTTTSTIVAFRDTGANYEGFLNGGRDGNTAYTRSGALTMNQFDVGLEFNGRISEVIVFGSALSDANLNVVFDSQGARYGIATTPFETPLTGEALEFAGLPRDGMFAEQNQNWEGYTATFGSIGGRSFGSVGSPVSFRYYYKTTTSQPNRITASFSDLNFFDTFDTGHYVGATARVHRVVNGAMQLVRTSTVTDAKVGRWLRFPGSVDQVYSGTSFTYAVTANGRPNVPYWFRVAAVGSDGRIGTFSAPVSLTPTTMTGTPSTPTNPTNALTRTTEGGPLAAPTGVSVVSGVISREAVVSWSAVSGAAGYVVDFSYYDPANIAAAPYLDLTSDPTPILASDLVILEKDFFTLSASDYCSRMFGEFPVFWNAPIIDPGLPAYKRDGNDWAYIAYSGDKPALAEGDYFLRRTAAAGQAAEFKYFWHSGTGQSFYPVLKAGVTYRVRAVMRANVPTTVSFINASPAGSNTTFNVGTTFTTFTHDIVPGTPPSGTQAYDWKLNFTAGGSPVSVDLAYFDIQEIGASANGFAAYPPPQNGYLRDHRFIKPGFRNYRLADNIRRGLKQHYDACVLNNCKPWFQLEWGTTQQELQDFVAYLAAPNGSHPMADLRLSQGIPEPWTSTFSDMKFENGNENWNTLFSFWVFPSLTDSVTGTNYPNGSVAGMMWQFLANAMKASPYWSTLAPKLTFHAGGFALGSFGEDAYRFYPDAKEVSVAAYNGGWDNTSTKITETGTAYDVVLSDSMLVQKGRAVTRVSALKSTCAALGRPYGGSNIRYAIYEAGPGYQLPGNLTAAERIPEEVVMKSRAAAVSTVDTMLTYAQQDFKSFNFFTLQQGDFWSSHATASDGGQEYITHALVRIIHENIAPAKVYGAPTATLGTKIGRLPGGSTGSMNAIGAYQLRNLTNPSKRMIVLVNRNLDPSQLDPADPLYSATPSGTVAFNVTTTWTSAASLKVWTAGIGPFRQHNRYPVGQRRNTSGALVSDPLCVAMDFSSTTVAVPSNIQNFPINASVGATSGGLPAGNVLIMLFEGVT